MESPVALLLSSSFSCPCLPHSPAVLHFSSRALFSRPFLRCRRVPSRISAALGDDDRWIREEQRWLRDEQRWLREEQRWLREEARWHAERRLMADELALLKREVEQLRAQVQDHRGFSTGAATLPSVIASLKQLVQSLPLETRPNLEFVEEEHASVSISDRPSSLTFDFSDGTSAPSLSPSPSIPSMSEFSIDLMTESPGEPASKRPRSAPFRELRKGAEGEAVKLLQEALHELGFYCGDEDIEDSTFSSGTETAVKSWQASMGAQEDGIASADLLATLFTKSKAKQQALKKKNNNGANGGARNVEQADPWKAPATGHESGKKTGAEETRAEQKREEGDRAPNRRVFLLGENRWEEPGRLRRSAAAEKPKAKTKGAGAEAEAEKCFSCKGEGVMICIECEGTGELNVEDQFLDWVDDGAKCPYCSGSGAVTCDVCDGHGHGHGG